MNLTNHLQALVDSVNAEDTEGFLDSFTDDALVDDDGHQYRGLLQIAEWNTRQIIGAHARIRTLGHVPTPTDDALLIEVRVEDEIHQRSVEAQWQDQRVRHLLVRRLRSARRQ